MVYYQPILSNEEWESGELSSFMVYRELKNAKLDYPNHQIAAFLDDDIEEPTFVVDEDDRTINYYVDIPQMDREEWLNVQSFKSKQEAIDYAIEHYGADIEGNVSLISQS
jgi:hypothetical protein